ncbi:interleukin-1 receptor type 2 isoform X2 [Coregonus clupeaformis]|uniref:Ig-like domain-containing protein n=1 Tax=Coregonus suidteri TaxID=861788 RepID=A0AAN8R2E1_9TELE|nr:interleukin-1 receptor type 2 isoform X2 [Coregonus clupeaformis]
MVTWENYAMVILSLLSALFIAHSACGRRLPPLPMIDGCFRVSPEPEVFRVQGEAVVLSCFGFDRVLQIRFPKAKAGYTYVVAKGNGKEGIDPEEGEEGRVLQRERQLWLLPARTSDSGEYSCIYRNDTLCVTGSITLQVYETKQTDIEKLSYPISTRVGNNVSISCPHFEFNRTDEIEWYKDSSLTVLPVGSGRYHRQRPDLIHISDVRPADQGFYTCQLRVHVNNLQYTVSRTMNLYVKVLDPVPYTQTTSPIFDPDTTPTPNPGLSTVEYPAVESPKIVSPVNGTIFESPLGSILEISCQVFTGSQSADATVVTWLVDGQSLDSSNLGGRALMSQRRVTTVAGGCYVEVKLYIVELCEEDTRAELKCVTQNQGGRHEVIAQFRVEDPRSTWLMVGVAVSVCFLTVVSIFLYLLLKPRGKGDYFLARQNSTFSSTFSSTL